MLYERIMVPLDLGRRSSARLKLAVNLAAQFDARLIGIAAREASRLHGHGKGGLITSKMIDSERRHAIYELSLVEAVFHKEAENLKEADYCSSLTEPGAFLLEQTRIADLVVCNRPYDGDLDEWFADLSPGTLLMRLGCPLLVAPLGHDGAVGRRIIVAWKDTREARRAVREAWPFLKHAEAVTMVTVGSDAEALGVNSISDALIRKDISCKVLKIDKKRPRVAAEILEFAAAENADLLIAGAYGHARLHELIFGSVTRDLLAASPISCLLSH